MKASQDGGLVVSAKKKAYDFTGAAPESMLLATALGAEIRESFLRLCPDSHDNQLIAWIVFGSVAAIGTVIGTIYKHRFLSAGESLKVDDAGKPLPLEQQQSQLGKKTKVALWSLAVSWAIYEGADAVMAGISNGMSLYVVAALALGKIAKTLMFEAPVMVYGAGKDVANYTSQWASVLATGMKSAFAVGIGLIHAKSLLTLSQLIGQCFHLTLQATSPVGLAIAAVGLIAGLAGTYLTAAYDFQGAKNQKTLGQQLFSRYPVLQKPMQLLTAVNEFFYRHPSLTIALNTVGQGALYAVGLFAGVKMLAGMGIAALVAAGPAGWAAIAAICVVAGAAAFVISRKKVKGIENYRNQAPADEESLATNPSTVFSSGTNRTDSPPLANPDAEIDEDARLYAST